MLVARLEQRLPDAGDVAVAEDAEAAGDQPLLDAVALGVLVARKRTSAWATVSLMRYLLEPRVTAAADRAPGLPRRPRIQACAGSSVKRHARSPGPAITFR